MATTRVESQRARVLDAIGRVVAERGYASATVADVVREAGVSRSTFYEQFASKEACFLEMYRRGVEVLDDRVRSAVHATAGAGWRVQLRAGIRAYLDGLAAQPDLARTYLLEIHNAGAEALDARDDARRLFAGRYAASYEQARADDPSIAEPHPDMLLVLAAGTEELCAQQVRTHGAQALPDLEDVFCASAEALLTHHNGNDQED
jgi:AcrR family transcriptional regulator